MILRMLIMILGPVFGHRNGTVIEVDQAEGERMLRDGGQWVTELVDGRPASRPTGRPAPVVPVPEPTVEVADDEYLPDAADDDDADEPGDSDDDDAIADALAVVDDL